ncbi:MAG TPA: DUF5668 domain-containing protein [Pseudomonadales bacterium]|nr:DUF5668 domain-containing protein [Pseudomonadales bacterium]
MNYLLPLSIIALGALLLLGNLNILSIHEIWLLLKTWWPVIIILWGLHMLAGDMDRSKNRKPSDNDSTGS